MIPSTGLGHVAVIGAGFAGLAAASALAARGHGVTLLEAREEVGGKARRVAAAGAVVDVGPTLLVDPGPLQALEAMAPPGSGPVAALTRVDPGVVATFGDRQLALWREAARRDASVAGLGPDAPADWRRLLGLGRRAARLAERFHEAGDVAGPRDLLRLIGGRGAGLADVWPFVVHRSLGAAAAHWLRTAELRRLVSHCARFLGVDAHRAPSVALVIPYLLATRGVWHPAGGFSGLAARLANLAAGLGAAVRTGEPVAGLEVVRGRVRALRLASGGRLAVDAVVAAIDPGVVAGWLPGSALAARVARRQPTLAAHVAWWVVESASEAAPPHALHFPAEPALEPLYVHRPDAIEPGLAPPGASLVYALVHAPAGPARGAGAGERLGARLAAAGAWPGGRVLASGEAGGGEGCYGYAPRPGLLGAMPLSQRVSGVTNLWLAGGGVFPGPGVSNVLRSGVRAATLAATALEAAGR